MFDNLFKLQNARPASEYNRRKDEMETGRTGWWCANNRQFKWCTHNFIVRIGNMELFLLPNQILEQQQFHDDIYVIMALFNSFREQINSTAHSSFATCCLELKGWLITCNDLTMTHVFERIEQINIHSFTLKFVSCFTILFSLPFDDFLYRWSLKDQGKSPPGELWPY